MTTSAASADTKHERARGRTWWQGPKAWIGAIGVVVGAYAWLRWFGSFLSGEASAPFWMATSMPVIYMVTTGMLAFVVPIVAIGSMIVSLGSPVPWYRSTWHLVIASILASVVVGYLTIQILFVGLRYVETTRIDDTVYHLAAIDGNDIHRYFDVYQCDSLGFWCQQVYSSYMTGLGGIASFTTDPETGATDVRICSDRDDDSTCELTFTLPHR